MKHYPYITKLRRPYQTTILTPPDFTHYEDVWIVGKVWYKQQYESACCRLLAQFPNGNVIEVN